MSDDPDSPPEREMKDFQFRQMKKTRVFASPDELPKERSSLLALSNKYGLTFVGQDRMLKVYFTKDILAADKVEGNSNEIVEDIAAFAEVVVELPLHNVALSSDELTLSACGMSLESGLLLAFYDVRAFLNQARTQKLPFATFRPGCGPGTCVEDLKWNPGQASMLATCLSDGSLMVLDVTDRVTVNAQLPASHGITCICWSPKGKQVAAGKMNATVSQYTPALQEKKVIPCPSFYSADNPVKVLDVLWLSTFVFAVAYAASDGSPETPPELVVISLPKKDDKRGEIYLNFNDLVYGSCIERQHHYLLSHIEDWDVVFAASAASIEVSVIAKQEDKTNWELWILEDASRAELPVSQSSEDTLPMGMAIDYTSQQDIYISDEKSLPPAPTMLLLSTDGVLCPFSLLNLNPGAKQLIAAPTALSLDGERLPPADSVAPPPISKPAAPVAAPAPAPTPTPVASFPPVRPAAATPPPPPASYSFPAPPAPTVSSSGFSFALPPSYTTSASAPAFSLGGSPRLASPSPITVLRGTPEPATPAIKLNLNDGLLAVETPAPGAPVSQSFSFAPKPVIPDPGIQTAAPPTAVRPPAMSVPVLPDQSITPPTMAQRAPPAPQTSAPTPLPGLSLKSLEKQLQQKKDSDPVMAGILEEIAHFEQELDDLKARSQRADFKVGTIEEMRSLRKESEDLHIFTLEIKETTESLHGDISCLKTTMLEGFAGAEDALSQSELNRDRGYLQLLCKKPLDPRSEDQLKEIRRLYQYVKFASEDVNDVLDVEWEKHLEMKKKQRHMVVPGRESLFTTLANNLEIINQQKKRLDGLAKELHALRLYNKTSSWNTRLPQPSGPASSQPSTAAGLDQELESLRDALLRATLETAPKTPSKFPAKMSPVKQSQLRNFLSKRQTPPVRSTAPANLSRSAFLSPKYYEDLDDVSCTSSLSQGLDFNTAVLELEEEEDLVPLPMPMMTHQAPSSMLPRHPTVVRTPSISVQSGFGAIGQSTPFSKVHHPGLGGLGMGLSPIASPVPKNKINLGGADSTALATKTVKHGAPPNEKVAPFTLPAQQAAATAALRRQMANQKPGGSLTESTLKTVPQVVNVQELKDSRGPPMPVSTVISSSVPAPAAQVVQQVLATVATNQAKRNPTQSLLKAAAERAASPQTGFVFGSAAGVAPKAAEGSSTSGPSLGEQSSKGFSFSAASSSAFSFSSVSQGAAGSQVKEGAKFSFSSAAASGGGSVGKMLFSSSATEEPFSFTPKSASASPALGAGSPTPPPTVSGEPVRPSSSTGALRVEPHPARGGETLGSFSGLRVGQGDEDTKDAPAKPATSGFVFAQPDSGGGGLGMGAAQFSFGTGATDLSKPVVSMSSGGVFKPPEPSAKTAFSSFNSLLTSSLESPEEPKATGPLVEPVSPLEPELSPELPADSPPVDSAAATTVDVQVPSPAVPTQTPTPPPVAPSPAPSQVPVASISAPVEEAAAVTPTQPPAPTIPVPTPETAPDLGALPTSAPSPLEAFDQPPPPPYHAPASDKPGSIFTQGTVTTDNLGVTPVIITAAPASASAFTTTTAAGSTIPSSAMFAQPPADPTPAPSPAPVPAASPAPSPAPPPAPTTAPTGFGTTAFSAASTGGFGQPTFGQTGGFGQPAPNTGFGFGQATFGASPGFGSPAPGAAPVASSSSTTGSGLFGAPTASNASSFSFGSSVSSTASSTGTGLFGQSAAPAFGQPGSGTFGQASVFGGNTTTTTSSTGFSFGQPAAFGSASGPSVFGQSQQASGGGVFGQTNDPFLQPSGGGLFGSGSGHAGAASTGGGFFSGLGGKPSEDAANKNPFGATPSPGGFGQPSQPGASSLFGSSGPKGFGFGQPAPFGEQKAGGTFTTGAGSVAAQGFGSFSTPAKPTGGFGSTPVFGSPPAFGGQPAFGGAAAFGAAPSFTSPMGSSAGKVFGEGTTASSMGGFGFASPQSAPSFGSIASQGAQAPSFGSLAQQSPGFGAPASTFGQTSGFGQPQGGGFPGGGFGSTNQLTPRWP